MPFSYKGHAVDMFRDRAALRDKIRRADFIVCISEFHRDYSLGHGVCDDQLHIVCRGIDAQAYPFRRTARSGRRPRILSVGRLVEQKGLHVLLDACRILADRGLEYECVFAGNGPMEGELRRLVADLQLQGRVELPGNPILQEQLPDFLDGDDVFAQPCV